MPQSKQTQSKPVHEPRQFCSLSDNRQMHVQLMRITLLRGSLVTIATGGAVVYFGNGLNWTWCSLAILGVSTFYLILYRAERQVVFNLLTYMQIFAHTEHLPLDCQDVDLWRLHKHKKASEMGAILDEIAFGALLAMSWLAPYSLSGKREPEQTGFICLVLLSLYYIAVLSSLGRWPYRKVN